MSSTPMRILVTAQAFAVSGTAYREKLGKLGCQVIDAETWGPLSLSDLIEQAKGFDAIIAAIDPYCQAAFEALPRLKLVARCGIGIDSIDLASATKHGILVTNVPDAMTDAVADYCLGLLLSLARHIHTGYQCMQAGGWAEFPGVELRGKTLGLIGLGRIGRAVAQRALGFGLQIVAHDPHVQNSVSRGNSDDEPTAVSAGAAMDVYEQEPLPANDPLRSTPNLLLTPHNAFNSHEAAVRMSLGCFDPIVDILEGRPPKSVCNPEALDSPVLRVKQCTL